MIRFACPSCGTSLKAPGDKMGITVKCPTCKQPTSVPFDPNNMVVGAHNKKAGAAPGPAAKPPPSSAGLAPPLGKSNPGLKPPRPDRAKLKVDLFGGFVVVCLAVAGVLYFVIPEGAGEEWSTSRTVGWLALGIGGPGLLAYPVLLVGLARRCPACREFWAREKRGDGPSRAHEVRYQCKHCRHKWSETRATVPALGHQ